MQVPYHFLLKKRINISKIFLHEHHCQISKHVIISIHQFLALLLYFPT